MEILYQDDAVVVCEKPAGVSSQVAGGTADLPRLLRAETGSAEIYPVHRLDTGATGLMVYAKTAAAAAQLSRRIADGSFRKAYLCAVHGIPAPAEGAWEDLLFHDRGKNKTYVVRRERKGVRRAALSYRVTETLETPEGPVSVVYVRLYTGRTHQIRAQFAARKYPLLGDGKYGAADRWKSLALYSCFLSFPHPETGAEMTFDRSCARFDLPTARFLPPEEKA